MPANAHTIIGFVPFGSSKQEADYKRESNYEDDSKYKNDILTVQCYDFVLNSKNSLNYYRTNTFTQRRIKMARIEVPFEELSVRDVVVRQSGSLIAKFHSYDKAIADPKWGEVIKAAHERMASKPTTVPFTVGDSQQEILVNMKLPGMTGRDAHVAVELNMVRPFVESMNDSNPVRPGAAAPSAPTLKPSAPTLKM